MKPIVRISHLDKYFDRLHVLKDLSFEVHPAEVICIIGRSGSGKSTLLRCINFLEEPDHGTIEVDGLAVEAHGHGRDYRQKVHDLRLKTGMVFQSFNLFPHMTALGNVIEGPITVQGMEKEEAIEWGLHNLERVGLIAKKDQYPSRLSGGQQQRVAIARAIVTGPDMLLADEPTGNLDTARGHEIMALLTRFNREQGLTIVMVTHEAEMAAYARRVITFVDGRVADGTGS